MKRTLLFFLTLIVLSSQAQTSGDYRNKATGNWNDSTIWERFDGANWQPAVKVPSAADGVIGIRSPYAVTIDTAVTADQLVIEAGASLSIASTLFLPNGNGDDLTCNGILVLSGTIFGAGSCVVNGAMDWSGGTCTVSMAISGSGKLNLLTASGKFINSPLTNAGTINWSSGSFSINNTTVSNSGIMNVVTDGNLTSSGNGSFTNSGTFEKLAGILTTLSIPVTNTGTFKINDGATVSNNSTFTNSGTISLPAGAAFANTRTLLINAGTTFSGSGTLQWGGQETINTAVSLPASMVLNVTAGNVAGASAISISGSLNWSGGMIGAPVSVLGGGTLNLSGSAKTLSNVLTNTGAINWSAGNLELTGGGTINNGGIFNNSFDGAISVAGNTNRFNNSGLFSKNNGTGITTTTVRFNNSGTVNVKAGILKANAPFTNTGTIDVSAAAGFTSAQYIELNPGTILSGNGSMTWANQEIVNTPLTIPATLALNKEGSLSSGSSPVTINGILNWTSGGFEIPLVIAQGATVNMSSTGGKAVYADLTNNGIINWTGGRINIDHSTFTNNGIFTASTGDNLSATQNATFMNKGIFNRTGGMLYTNVYVPFYNSGTINVSEGGTFYTSTVFTNSGKINLMSTSTYSSVFQNVGELILDSGTEFSGKGILFWNGDEIINTPVSIPPTILLTKVEGATEGTAAVSVNLMNWYGGGLGSPFIVPAGGTMYMTSNPGRGLYDTLTNYGTIIWNNGTVQLARGTIYNKGNFIMALEGLFFQTDSNSLFLNSGTFTKTVSTLAASTMGVPFVNTGTLKGVGNLIFSNTFTSKGSIEPGVALGTMYIRTSASPVFNPGGSVRIEIRDNAGAGIGNDLLKVDTQALSGNLTITELGTPPDGTYTIISSSGKLTGAFSSVSIPDSYSVVYTPNAVLVVKQTVLPVKLLSFKALMQGTSVQLIWTTAAEYNSDRFEVERSSDGRNFGIIGVLRSTGDSIHQTDYAFLDKQPANGMNYYRLKMMDKDGRFEYSRIMNIAASVITSHLSIYPNPARTHLTINGLNPSRPQTIRLVDVAGHIIYTMNPTGDKLDVDMSRQPHGVYWLQLFDEGKLSGSYRIIKE